APALRSRRTIALSLRCAATASGPRSACCTWPVRRTVSGTASIGPSWPATRTITTPPTTAAATSSTTSQTIGWRQGELSVASFMGGSSHGPEEGAVDALAGAAVARLDHEFQRMPALHPGRGDHVHARGHDLAGRHRDLAAAAAQVQARGGRLHGHKVGRVVGALVRQLERVAVLHAVLDHPVQRV